MKIDDIKVIQWNNGYDRNGSHDAGEYVEYTGTIGYVLLEDGLCSFELHNDTVMEARTALDEFRLSLEEWKKLEGEGK